MYSRVLGTGSALPQRIVTNRDFAAMLARDGIETSDEWIRTRTGIESRRFADAAEGETTSSLAVAAAREALEAAGIEAGEIDLIIVATTTPDMVFPSVACRVQAGTRRQGLRRFRRSGRLRGLHLCAQCGRCHAARWPLSSGDRDRRRGDVASPRHEGPFHLRALRRRRGRCRAQGFFRSGHSRRTHVR